MHNLAPGGLSEILGFLFKQPSKFEKKPHHDHAGQHNKPGRRFLLLLKLRGKLFHRASSKVRRKYNAPSALPFPAKLWALLTEHQKATGAHTPSQWAA